MSKSQIVAMSDNVFVVRPKSKKTSNTGVILPASSTKEPHYGKVVAVGPDVKTEGLVGKIAIFDIKAGYRVQVSDMQELDLWWMNEMSLLLTMTAGEARKRGFSIPKDTVEDLVRV